jgi:hypothetical protein
MTALLEEKRNKTSEKRISINSWPAHQSNRTLTFQSHRRWCGSSDHLKRQNEPDQKNHITVFYIGIEKYMQQKIEKSKLRNIKKIS